MGSEKLVVRVLELRFSFVCVSLQLRCLVLWGKCYLRVAKKFG